MIKLWAVGACAFVLMGCATASASDERAAADGLLIRSVSIVDPDAGTVSAPADILIENGRIARVLPAGTSAAPEGVRQVEGAGRFAVAGLIDVHAHVGEGGVGPQNDVSRARALRQFLRYGVTTIFVPGATGAGDSDFPALQARCRAREIECPGLHGSGSIITALGSHPVSTIFGMPDTTPASVLEARGVQVLRPGDDLDRIIGAKAAAGATAIKIVVEDGPPPWYPKPRLSDEQIARIVKVAHGRSLPVVAHISSARLVRVVVDAGVDGIMHAPIEPLQDDLVADMARRKVWYVPTFSLYDGLVTWARKEPESDPYARKGVEPSALQSLAVPAFLAASDMDVASAEAIRRNVVENLRRVTAAGVPVALGSDVNNPFVYPGYSAHEELTWMVRAGMSPAAALRAATTGAATFLRAQQRVGRIAPGYEADLLLLARNPLARIENSRSLVAVIADGRLVDGVVSVD